MELSNPAASGTSTPIGYVSTATSDDGDSPSVALFSATDSRSRQSLTGRGYLGAGNSFKVFLYNRAGGFTLVYASVLLASADFVNTAWYRTADPAVINGADRITWDPTSESLEGTGVAIDPVDATQLKVTDAGVYDFRILVEATV